MRRNHETLEKPELTDGSQNLQIMLWKAAGNVLTTKSHTLTFSFSLTLFLQPNNSMLE